MSYEILWRGLRAVPTSELYAMAQRQPRGIRIEGNGESIILRNENTGFYCTLESDGDAEICVLINYLRPSFFAREGLRTSIAFAKTFGGTLYDPQLETDLELEFDAIDEPLAAWKAGNRLSLPLATGLRYVDETKATKAWLHNYWISRVDRELEDGDVDVCYPRIFFAEIDGLTKTIVMADPTLTAMAIPDVDYIATPQRGLFGKAQLRLTPRDAALAAAEPNLGTLKVLDGLQLPVMHHESGLDTFLRQAGLEKFHGAVLAEDDLIDDASYLAA